MKPTLQALVLADQVYQDRRTNKMVIAGTFTTLFARQFPAVFGRPTFAYACLTDIRGTTNLRVRYIDLKDLSVLLESPELQVQAQDRFASTEIVMEVPPLPMPHAGTYAFELHADDERIGSIRVTAAKQETPS